MAQNGQNWRDAEFGSTIVRLPGGRFGTVGDAIFSSSDSEKTSLPVDIYSDFVGLVHNHAGNDSDSFANPLSYPSYFSNGSGDWAALEQARNSIVGISSTSDPSIFIIDPRGTVREFKLSEKAFFIGLTEAQMRDGVGLAGRERTDQCN